MYRGFRKADAVRATRSTQCRCVSASKGLGVLLLFAAIEIGLPASVDAQVIPAPTPQYPQDPLQSLHYKDGNGPAVSYFQRWIPSNWGCDQLTHATDLISQYTNPLKCIPLGLGSNSYITLNGTERFRNENISHSSLHADATVNANGTLGKNVTLNQTERYLTHSAVGADVHITDYFRAYGQVDNATQSGRQIQNGPQANNRNDLSLLSLFAEGRSKPLTIPGLEGTIVGLRAGRENLGLGSDTYWNADNGGTNLAGTSLDGIHAFADQGPRRLDIFGFHFVNEVNHDPIGGSEPFLDRDNAKELFWGGYFSNDLPRYRVLGMDTKTGVDAFYYGYSNSAAQYTNRLLLKNPASPAIAAAGASFITAHDYRHSLGLRFYGDIGNFDMDWSGVIQRGSFGSRDVSAWAFHSSTGYNLPLPWKPWLGLWLDGASGGVSKDSISTFQPIRQNPYALSTINVSQALTNVIDISPRIAFTPDFHIGSFHVEKMGVTFWYSFYFRQNVSDAVYSGVYFGNATATAVNPYQATAVTRGTFIGQQPNIRIYYAIAPHFNYGLDVAYQFNGAALKAVGAKDTLYIRNQIYFDF